MQIIDLNNLFILLLPIGIVGFIYYKWIGNAKEILYATVRMVLQLITIGYLLMYIFDSNDIKIGIFILLFMVAVSSLIALRNSKKRTLQRYREIFLSIALSGTFNLLLVLYGVIGIEPLYQPRFIIPLSGMIYANTMNAISLASERYDSEIERSSYIYARAVALKSALIPQINAFLAVGLVSLPGMMTGQILSGVDPIVAVRYQIVVMAMILGSAGMGVIIYLVLQSKK